MVSENTVLMTTIIDKLASIPEMKAGEKHEMPWVPDRVMPAAEIHELLRDWVANLDKWGEIMSEAVTCQQTLVELAPVAANRRVVGL